MPLAGHQLPFIQLLGLSRSLLKDSSSSYSEVETPRSPMLRHPDNLLILGDSKVEVTSPFMKLFRSSSSWICSEPEEVRTSPPTGVYRGTALYGPGQTIPTETRIQALTACPRLFSLVGAYRPALFRSLLGLMTTTLQSVKHAYLHMRYIQ